MRHKILVHDCRQHLTCSCLPALSHSGRHEHTTLFALLLCAGPIEGCSAVLAVRRYCSGLRSLVCTFVWCAQKKKRQVQKTKNLVVVGVPQRYY